MFIKDCTPFIPSLLAYNRSTKIVAWAVKVQVQGTKTRTEWNTPSNCTSETQQGSVRPSMPVIPHLLGLSRILPLSFLRVRCRLLDQSKVDQDCGMGSRCKFNILKPTLGKKLPLMALQRHSEVINIWHSPSYRLSGVAPWLSYPSTVIPMCCEDWPHLNLLLGIPFAS